MSTPRRPYALAEITNERPRRDKGYGELPPSSASARNARAALSSFKFNSKYSVDIAIEDAHRFVGLLPRSQFRCSLLSTTMRLQSCHRLMKSQNSDYFYWIYDFLAPLAELLDQYGPNIPEGRDGEVPDCELSWIFVILRPFLLISIDSDQPRPLNACQTSVYKETCLMLRTLYVMYSHIPNIYKELLERGWDLLIDALADEQQEIVDAAFTAIQVILLNVEISHNLVCKVILIRAVTLGFEEESMALFRAMRAVLIEIIVSRICSESKNNEINKSYLDDCVQEMNYCIMNETDENITRELEKALKIAKETTQKNQVRMSTLMMVPTTELPYKSGANVEASDDHRFTRFIQDDDLRINTNFRKSMYFPVHRPISEASNGDKQEDPTLFDRTIDKFRVMGKKLSKKTSRRSLRSEEGFKTYSPSLSRETAIWFSEIFRRSKN